MKVLLPFLGVAAILVGAPITLPNTGVGSVAGAAEANWRLRFCGASIAACAGAFSTPFETDLGAGFPSGFWLANDATSQWISPQGNYSALGSDPEGFYQWQLTFDLAGLNPATASINFRVVSDDPFAGFAVNGNAVSGAIPGSGYTPFSSNIAVASGFVGGVNTFNLFVQNAPPNGPNPTGIRVELTGNADPFPVNPPNPNIPEPSTLALFSSGLLFLAWRRTRG